MWGGADTVVGLIYDEELAPRILCLHLDLGRVEQVDLYRELLEANMLIAAPETGYFAVHPNSGSIVYRVNLPLTSDVDGGHLAGVILDFLELAQGKLSQILSGT